MFDQVRDHYVTILREIRETGLAKDERVIASPQGAEIEVGAGGS